MYYHIILGNKHIDIIKASSQEEAIHIITKKFGPASVFSSRHVYRAVRA